MGATSGFWRCADCRAGDHLLPARSCLLDPRPGAGPGCCCRSLRDTDPVTLALVMMGLTLDQRDGVLLTDEAPEEVFVFFAEIAPEHHLYVQVDNRWSVNIDVGVFRRPREHMRGMIRAQYPGYRICSDPLGPAGAFDGYVEALDDDGSPPTSRPATTT